MKILKNWYIDDGLAFGVVKGHERIENGRFIHTSEIENIKINHDGSVIINTLNSEYHTHMKDALYEKFSEDGKDRIIGFDKYKVDYERCYHLDTDGVLLVLDSDTEYYFGGCLVRFGKYEHYETNRFVHIGMFQDSILISNKFVMNGKEKHLDYRYFPYNYYSLEFYCWDKTLNTQILNRGENTLKVAIEGKEYNIEPNQTIQV